jgi:hypothetical protein
MAGAVVGMDSEGDSAAPVTLAGSVEAGATASASPQEAGKAKADESPIAAAAAETEAPPSSTPDKPWTIPQPCVLQQLGVRTFGWLEQGVVFNSLSPADRWNGPVVTADRSNDYEMNQLWLGFVRPTKTDGDGFDLGGRIDLAYGTDWRYGDCYGLEQSFEHQQQIYGLCLPQFYLEASYNNATVKVGHFAAVMGYEIVPGPGNFFYTHSYALGYSEPVLVTGFQVEYRLTDQWTLLGGLHDGWQAYEELNKKANYLGGVKWHNDADTTDLSFEITIGPQDPAGQDNLYDYALVLKQKLSEKLLYVAHHSMGGAENSNPRTGGYARWYGLDQYLIYTINPKLSVGSRVEWFRDEDGSRVAGVGNLNDGWMGAPGFAGTFTEATFGLNWRPHPNLVVRPELRWDWYRGSTNLAGQLPFGDGNYDHQFLFATDVIFSF